MYEKIRSYGRIAAIRIQSRVRGMQSRRKAREMLQEKRRLQELGTFHLYATQIQRIWRGYAVRLHHDYYKRKLYLQQVSATNATTRETLQAYYETQLQHEMQSQFHTHREDFAKACTKLHHLISTKTIPGVYNTPTRPSHTNLVFNQPVEAHLQNAMQHSLRITHPMEDRLPPSQFSPAIHK